MREISITPIPVDRPPFPLPASRTVMRKTWLTRAAYVAFAGLSCIASCARMPTAEEGRTRLVGRYQFFDRRVPTSDVNPSYRSASLVLRADGTAVQTCEYKDSTKYVSSGMTWEYRGDGNVHLSPLKDCSWVMGALMEPREGPLEAPRGGASLIVEWGPKPNILMDPDLNAFYQWQERSPEH